MDYETFGPTTDYVNRLPEWPVGAGFTAVRFPVPVMFVMINGPKNGGKSTLAHLTRGALLEASPHDIVLIESFKGPLIELLGLLMPDLEYSAAKSTIYAGKRGREIQIEFGAMLREHEDILSKLLIKRVHAQLRHSAYGVDKDTQRAFVLIDDWGFDFESNFMAKLAIPMTHVYQSEYNIAEDVEPTAHGAQFPFDSRYCYRNACELINPQHDEAAAYLLERFDIVEAIRAE